MTNLRFAAISDVHGNIWALDAVLADIRRRGLREVVNLGDHLYGPLKPVETAERLRQLPFLHIRGNCDRILCSPLPDRLSHTWSENQRELDPATLLWLQGLPEWKQWGDVLLCHGTPESDSMYLLEHLSADRGAELRPAAEVESLLGNCGASLVLCGHSHVPRIVKLTNGVIVVNPGSVGLPAYSDEEPVQHKMESGSPHARYAIVARDQRAWHIEAVEIAYDWNRAADLAHEKGRDDWAFSLATGKAKYLTELRESVR